MRRWIIGIVLIVALLGIGAWYIQNQGGAVPFLPSASQAEETPTPILTTGGPREVIVDAKVVPIQYAALSMKSGGTVADVLVEEGEAVAADQMLARIDNEQQVIAIAQAEAGVRSAAAQLEQLRSGARPEEIAGAQAAVDAARANLAKLTEPARSEDIAAAQAQLAAAQASLQNVLEGADEEQLVAAQAELQNAEAAVRQAQNAYNEVKWRNDAGALPQAAQLEQTTNNLEAARARLDLLEKGADASDIARARAEVEAGQAALDKLNAPATAAEIAAAEAEVRRAAAELALRRAGARVEEIQAAEARLTEAGTNLMQRQNDLVDTELRAPFTGTVAAISLRPGEQVAAGTPVAQLADESAWLIETDDLTEIDVVSVQEGDSVRISIDALPDLELTGKVIRIKPFGESKQGDITYTVTIAPDQMDPRLRWNMTASVTIEAAE